MTYKSYFWILRGLLIITVGILYACNNATVPIIVSPSAMCDVAPLGESVESDDDTATVRFVAYGDFDSDDDVPCGMLLEVRIAVVEADDRLNWWEAVGGSELGIEGFIPPRARVPTTAERLAAAPAQFVTTGADGTAEMLVAYDPKIRVYSVCAILPGDDLIAGCNNNDLRIGESTFNSTVYIYFTHGHAILEVESSDRYQRFLNGTASSTAPATIMFEATSYRMISEEGLFRRPAL